MFNSLQSMYPANSHWVKYRIAVSKKWSWFHLKVKLAHLI